MAKARGHQVMLTTATAFQSAVEAAGVQFFPLKSAANFDFRDMAMLFPERTSMIPGPEMMRFDYERVFIDTMLPQAETLMEIVQRSPQRDCRRHLLLWNHAFIP